MLIIMTMIDSCLSEQFQKKKTKIKTRLKFSQGIVRVLSIMTKYEEARVKLTNTQINKLKSAAKNKKGTIF